MNQSNGRFPFGTLAIVLCVVASIALIARAILGPERFERPNDVESVIVDGLGLVLCLVAIGIILEKRHPGR